MIEKLYICHCEEPKATRQPSPHAFHGEKIASSFAEPVQSDAVAKCSLLAMTIRTRPLPCPPPRFAGRGDAPICPPYLGGKYRGAVNQLHQLVLHGFTYLRAADVHSRRQMAAIEHDHTLALCIHCCSCKLIRQVRHFPAQRIIDLQRSSARYRHRERDGC